MYYPTFEELEAKIERSDGNLALIYREVRADLETPVSAYLKIAKGPYSFLLESVEGGERIARYSFIGTEPRKVIKTGPGEEYGEIDPLLPIQEELAKYTLMEDTESQRFSGGAVGYLAYDSVNYFERLPSAHRDLLGLPESVFMVCDTFVIFDHLQHKMQIVSHVNLDDNFVSSYDAATQRIDRIVERLRKPLNTIGEVQSGRTTTSTEHSSTQSNMSQEEYESMVHSVKDYVTAGDVIQTVVAQRLERSTKANPFEIYRALRGINPSPYMYYLNLDQFQIVGASPEMLVQVVNGIVATHPIAGTRPRGATQESDEQNEAELKADEKERAEHIMLVDLGRNDIGRVSEPGTVEVTQLMDIERYSHVMHLVSHVVGELRSDYTCFDALRACFPAGTVSGAPKIRAMEIIAELESDKRGPYAGAVGYFDMAGNMDTAIAIRTLIVKDGVAYAEAGGGIVYDSVPTSEYEETLHKASALMRAIDQAETEL